MKNSAGFRIYINEHSGTVMDMGRDKLEQMIVDSHLPIDALYFLPAKDLIEKLEEEDGRAPILIGGGDGTIKSCAAHLMETGVPFGILPLGTMNLLARDLNIPVNLKEALQAYQEEIEQQSIDVGIVVGQKVRDIFLCCVGLGTMPETSAFREEHRGESQPILIPRLTAYVLQQMDRRHRRKLSLEMDNRKLSLKTSALVVSNNEYGPQEEWSENNFKRSNLQDGVLGVYSAAPLTLWDKMRLLLRLRVGSWQRDESLQVWRCERLKIGSKDDEVLLSLDGETQRFKMPIKISIQRLSLNLLVPSQAGVMDE